MRILLAVALCTFALGASAQLYRWTDDQGRVHVTDVPPPASAKDVKKIDVRTSPPPAAAAESKSSQQEPYALQRAQSKYPITLYTIPDCEGCNHARKLLNARGIPFTEISLTDPSKLDDFKKAVGGNTVPAMIVGSTVQKGFEESAYQSLLDAAGYPVTGVLPPRDQQPTAAAPNLPEVKPAPEPEKPTGPYAPDSPPPPPPTKKKK